MVTPEEIARAMAVHSADDESRRANEGDHQVLVDTEQVKPTDDAIDSEPGQASTSSR